jgi:hypothetical protein
MIVAQKKFSDEMLVAVSQNPQNARIMRDIASYAMNLRLRVRGEIGPDTGVLERQVRDLSAENKRLRNEIAALRSMTKGE